jgi:hypothetical protein
MLVLMSRDILVPDVDGEPDGDDLLDGDHDDLGRPPCM